MITILVSKREDGFDVAETNLGNGVSINVECKTGAEMRVARYLVTLGAEDQPWRTVGKNDGKPRLHGPSLHGLIDGARPDCGKSGVA